MAVNTKFIINDLTAIISDYVYYIDHHNEIDRWLESNNCERQGMIIKFFDEKTKMLFLIKWM